MHRKKEESVGKLAVKLKLQCLKLQIAMWEQKRKKI